MAISTLGPVDPKRSGEWDLSPPNRRTVPAPAFSDPAPRAVSPVAEALRQTRGPAAIPTRADAHPLSGAPRLGPGSGLPAGDAPERSPRSADAHYEALHNRRDGCFTIDQFPQDLQVVMKSFDLDGDGTVSGEEVAHAARMYKESLRRQRHLVRAVVGITVVLLLSLTAIFGLTYVVVELTKDTDLHHSGALKVKGTDVPVTTAATKVDVPLGMVPLLGAEYLHGIGSIVLHNRREQEVKRVVAGIDLTSPSSFTLRTTLGDLIVVEDAVRATVTFSGESPMAVCGACTKCASFSVVETAATLAIRDRYAQNASDLLSRGLAPACKGQVDLTTFGRLHTLGDTREARPAVAGGAVRCKEGTAATLRTVVVTGVVQFGIPPPAGGARLPNASQGDDEQEGWFAVGGAGTTCIAAKQRDVAAEQVMDAGTCRTRCEAAEWCNFISLVTPDDRGWTVCWLNSDCQQQVANAEAAAATAWQLRYRGLHPAVASDLIRYTTDRIAVSLGLAAGGVQDDVNATVEYAGDAPMLRYNVTLRGALASGGGEEAATKIQRSMDSKPHGRFYPVKHRMENWGADVVTPDAVAAVREDAAGAPPAAAGPTGSAAGGLRTADIEFRAERKRLLPRARLAEALGAGDGGAPHRAARRGDPAGWESGLGADGELQRDMPGHAWHAVHVDLRDGVKHLPGHLKRHGGVRCDGADYIHVHRQVIEHAGGLPPGGLLYGTGCMDWVHQVFAVRVLHVHPHADHPNASAAVRVEPVPVRDVVGRFHYETYLPPPEHANVSVRADCDYRARERFAIWRQGSRQSHRRVSEVHDMIAHTKVALRRARAMWSVGGDYSLVDTTKLWTLNYPIVTNSGMSTVFQGGVSSLGSMLKNLGKGWGVDSVLKGASPEISLTKNSKIELNLGAFFQGKAGIGGSCSVGWSGVHCEVHKNAMFSFELRGSLMVRMIPVIKGSGKFENVNKVHGEIGAQLGLLGINLYAEMGLTFEASREASFSIGGAQMDYSVTLGRKYTCNPSCSSVNTYQRSGGLSLFAPGGATPRTPVVVKAGMYVTLGGDACFPSCSGVTLLKSGLSVTLSATAEMDLTTGGCERTKRTTEGLLQQYHVPSSWCTYYGGCSSAPDGWKQCIPKRNKLSATGCMAEVRLEYCPDPAESTSCEVCPVGRCVRSGAQCKVFYDGYHCTVHSKEDCPKSRAFRCRRSGTAYTYSLAEHHPCVPPLPTFQPVLSARMDLDIDLTLTAGLTIEIWFIHYSLTFADWRLPLLSTNLYRSGPWRPKWLSISSARYSFSREAHQLALPGAELAATEGVDFPAAAGAATDPAGASVGAAQAVGVYLRSDFSAGSPPAAGNQSAAEAAAQTADLEFDLSPPAVVAVTTAAGFSATAPLTVNISGGMTVDTSPIYFAAPSHMYRFTFPGAAGSDSTIVMQVPAAPEEQILRARVIPSDEVDVDFVQANDNEPVRPADCHENGANWRWDADQREWVFPRPPAGSGCSFGCSAATGGCLRTFSGTNSAFMYAVLEGDGGSTVQFGITHEARIAPGRGIRMMASAAGYGPLIACAPPPTIFARPNSTQGDPAPRVSFAIGVTQADSDAGAKVGAPAPQNGVEACLRDPGQLCPPMAWSGRCATGGALPDGSARKSEPPRAWAQVKAPSGAFTFSCAMAAAAGTHSGGPLRVSENEQANMVLSSSLLAAADAGKGFCMQINSTAPGRMQWFIGDDLLFTPEAVQTNPVCQVAKMDPVTTGLTELLPARPIWLSSNVVGAGKPLRLLFVSEAGKQEEDEPSAPPLWITLESPLSARTSARSGLTAQSAPQLITASPAVLDCDLAPARVLFEVNCGFWPPPDILPEDRLLAELLKIQDDPLAKSSIRQAKVFAGTALMLVLVVPEPTAGAPQSGLLAGASRQVTFRLPDSAANIYGSDAASAVVRLTKSTDMCADGIALKFGV